MKKTLTIIALALLVFSCSNDSSSSSNDNKASGNVDYEFTISINGEVHKVKGNTVSGLPSGSGASQLYNNNTCLANNIPSFGTLVDLGINDVTANNYISGQNIRCTFNLGNLLLGENKVDVIFYGKYFDDLSASLGGSVIGFSYQSTSGKPKAESNKLAINITDLGTTSTLTVFPYKYGNTLKGNYSGTIYLLRKDLSTYDIPVQLSIDFKAVRMY
jgi:hypothetical protein